MTSKLKKYQIFPQHVFYKTDLGGCFSKLFLLTSVSMNELCMYGLFISGAVVIDNGDCKDDDYVGDTTPHRTNMMFIHLGKFIEKNPEDANSMKCPEKVVLKGFVYCEDFTYCTKQTMVVVLRFRINI